MRRLCSPAKRRKSCVTHGVNRSSTNSWHRTASRLAVPPSSPTSAACFSARCRKSTQTTPPGSSSHPRCRRKRRAHHRRRCRLRRRGRLRRSRRNRRPRLRFRLGLRFRSRACQHVGSLHPGARPQKETVMSVGSRGIDRFAVMPSIVAIACLFAASYRALLRSPPCVILLPVSHSH